jgi:hypothetical protein
VAPTACAEAFGADMSAGAELSALFYKCPCGKADTVGEFKKRDFRILAPEERDVYRNWRAARPSSVGATSDTCRSYGALGDIAQRIL